MFELPCQLAGVLEHPKESGNDMKYASNVLHLHFTSIRCEPASQPANPQAPTQSAACAALHSSFIHSSLSGRHMLCAWVCETHRPRQLTAAAGTDTAAADLDIFSPVSPGGSPETPQGALDPPGNPPASALASARLSAEPTSALPALAPFVPSMLKSDLLRSQPQLPWVSEVLRALSGDGAGSLASLVSSRGLPHRQQLGATALA